MKKTKLLMPILVASTLTPAMVSIASCSVKTSSIILIADEGNFAENKKVVAINHVHNGTKLSSLKQYQTPTLKNMQFVGWTDQNGKYVEEDAKISGDLILKANFDEEASSSIGNFAEDSWATIIDVINQGYVKFARTYCEYTGRDEASAIFAIKRWIVFGHSEYGLPLKSVTLSYENMQVEAYVHPIDINRDVIYGTDKKAAFTFEFYDIVDVSVYSADKEITHWYLDDNDDIKEAFLRKYLNNNVFNYLPVILRKEIKTVQKANPRIVMDGSGYRINDLTFAYSPEKLAPLNVFENSSWVYLNTQFANLTSEEELIEPYWFYSALASEGGLQVVLSKPVIGSYDVESVYNWQVQGAAAYVDYWLRTDSITFMNDDDPLELANALGIYVFDGANAMVCPMAPSDLGIGVTASFCI